MKRALVIVLVAAVLVMAFAAFMPAPAKAGGPDGYGYGAFVFPGSGYNKVCMYSYWNCSYRFVPPGYVSGYYNFPYNTYFRSYTPYNQCGNCGGYNMKYGGGYGMKPGGGYGMQPGGGYGGY